MWIISAIIVGLLAGFLARAIVPGSDSMGVLGTLMLGTAGSLVGGFFAWILTGRDGGALQLSGIIGSVVGSIIVLLFMRRSGSSRAA